MKAAEVYELTTQGGATDFAKIIGICDALGNYCLIGGLAVNCYVEPVYTLDADFVISIPNLPALQRKLQENGFRVESFAHSLNAQASSSQLRVQFTTDPRYQEFPKRAIRKEVLGVAVPVAALEDVVQGKLWSYSDPGRRFSKRKKDELDLLRLAETYTYLWKLYPADLASKLRE